MENEALKNKLIELLEEAKAEDIQTFNVAEMTSLTDYMVVAGGTSNRHVRAIARRLMDDMREAGVRPMGSEGADHGEWVLLDYGDVVVHVMQPDTREFYQLEKLWNPDVKEMLRVHRESAND